MARTNARTKTLSPPQQIAAYYRARIDRGTIADGQQIESRRAIATQWDVAVGTVTKAFATLATEGYVSTKAHRHGGTYAIGPESRNNAA